MKHLFLALLLALGTPASAQETLPSIVLVADGNLAMPLAAIVRDYARLRGTAVALALTDTESLSSQIAEGSNADVLITARTGWLTQLKQQGLVDIYSETPLARDRLALIGPQDFAGTVELAKGFNVAALGPEPSFVVAHPETLLEAEAAQEALKNTHAGAELEPYTVYAKQRRQMHEMLAQPGAFGILPATDAQLHHLRILDYFPEASHAPIAYKAVVLAGENMDEARKFVEYLKTPGAQAAFTRFGFME